MSKNNIGISIVAPIGLADIDVYNTNKRKFDDFPPKYAEKVKIRIGVFFDGTGNNSYNSDVVYYKQSRPIDTENLPEIRYKGFDVKPDYSYWNRYTNIKLLYDLYEEKTKRDDSKNVEYQYLQLKVYMQGIGTLKEEEDDTLGTAFGEGDRGVIGRVEQACADIATQINDAFKKIKSKKLLYIDAIQFDVFGFSRGAAAARHFCNEVLKQNYIYKNATFKEEAIPLKKDKLKKDYYLVEKKDYNLVIKDKTSLDNKNRLYVFSKKEFTGGKLGEELKAKKIKYPLDNVHIEFLGLFETVIAQFLEKKGAIDFAREITLPINSLILLSPPLVYVDPLVEKLGQIKKVNPDVSHPNIKKIFQLQASDECRENFAITPITNYSYGSTVIALGVHSDIGGGYWNTKEEINTLHFLDLPLNADDLEVDKVNNFKQQLRQWYIDNWYCTDDIIYWETMHHVRIFPNAGITTLAFVPALIKDTIMGDQTEKIIDGKKYQLVGYHYLLKSERALNNKLSLVYMNVMKHMATKFADVPLLKPDNKKLKIKNPEEYTFDKNYDLSKSKYPNTKSYQDLMIAVAEDGWAVKNEKPIEHKDLFTKEDGVQSYKIPSDLYRGIKLHFVHLSANFNSPIPHLGLFSEYQSVYPCVPRFTFDKDYKNPPYQREVYTPKLDLSDKR
jgi:Uncharacterized alpha/beta hydrolase domain (DUF2235)